MPRLWRYNLHYFDYILDSSRDPSQIARLIDDWIAKNPPGCGEGWEPYPLSLRLVNWIKYLLTSEMAEPPAHWVQCLGRQAAWLEANVEHHLRANHLLKNAVALVFAGACLEGEVTERWRTKGLRILDRELDEQMLDDGGHFERSPMYHAIVLQDLLDLANLLGSNQALQGSAIHRKVRDKARAALQFLEEICLPDGRIPLFNDAAFGIAPEPKVLFDYGARVLGFARTPGSSGICMIEKRQSGYYGWRAGTDMLLADCGPIGPDYQPGHAHCDTLSYELVLSGRRVIVDSGVHDYEQGPLRDYVRSTSAHNTVRVDGAEQSEIWGVFRVARRAYPLDPHLGRRGAELVFRGAHDGYRRLRGSVIHERTIKRQADGAVAVADRVTGKGRHRVESFIHIHPDYRVERAGNALRLVSSLAAGVPRVRVSSACEIRVETGSYCPEFGRRIDNAVIVLEHSGELPIELDYLVEN